jgi:NAD-dependent SIR2 family protein deacetylase
VLETGSLPECPECTEQGMIRQQSRKRRRVIGSLRPSIVLYGESHWDSEEISQIIFNDFSRKRRKVVYSGIDLLLVAGTSLSIPGVKNIIKDFKKIDDRKQLTRSCFSTKTEESLRSIYINLDFPTCANDLRSVFDVWLQGDLQTFANMVTLKLMESPGGSTIPLSKELRLNANNGTFDHVPKGT